MNLIFQRVHFFRQLDVNTHEAAHSIVTMNDEIPLFPSLRSKETEGCVVELQYFTSIWTKCESGRRTGI